MEGAQTEFRPLTHEEHLIYDEAMKSVDSIKFEPLAIATQVINGTMYIILGNAAHVRPESVPYLALVYIAKLVSGETKVEKIVKLTEEK